MNRDLASPKKLPAEIGVLRTPVARRRQFYSARRRVNQLHMYTYIYLYIVLFTVVDCISFTKPLFRQNGQLLTMGSWAVCDNHKPNLISKHIYLKKKKNISCCLES